MHGVSWNGLKERYLTLLDDAVTRWDVDWVIGEFLGELNSSHTYHGGGDQEQGSQRSVGLLGVDWELANGAYRIRKIIRGGPWDSGVRSPLDEPGRDAPSQQWPPVAHRGPKVMLINGWSGSGGDAFPFYFRQQGLGPLIGTRTWGGLIGISGAPQLVDGGAITVPTFRMYDPKGQWFAEGHGVDPDIPVDDDDPSALAKGTDPQLQRAIQEVLTRIASQPPAPPRPPYERRVPPR